MDQGQTGPAESQPKRGGVLTLLMNQSGDPPSFDLHQESGSAAMESAGPAYENLVAFNPANPREVIPELAEGWNLSADGLVYTFHLQRGIVFHNTNFFTSADAKFSLERVINPPGGTASPRRSTFLAVASIETPDDYTLRIVLKRPNPSLLVNLAQGWMAVYDKEWVESNGQDAPKKELMGTGPFRFKEYLPGSYILVERNPDYWQSGVPDLAGIKTLVVPDFSTRTAAFRTRQVDIARLYAQDAKQLEQELGDQIRIAVQPSPSFGALYMNTTRAPFDKLAVRQALNLAINRYEAVQVLAQGEGDIGGYMMPGGAWALSQEEVARFPGYARDKAPDLTKARNLLSQAGYPKGFTTEILTRNGRSFVDTAVLLQDQLRQLGVTATIVPVETVIANQRADRGEFQLLTWGHEFALDDPDAVYGEFYICQGARNWSRLCLQEFDALYERQSQEVDSAKRLALVQEMERKAVPEVSKIITHWNRRFDGIWGYVKNYVQHPSPFTNVRYRQVWLDR